MKIVVNIFDDEEALLYAANATTFERIYEELGTLERHIQWINEELKQPIPYEQRIHTQKEA